MKTFCTLLLFILGLGYLPAQTPTQPDRSAPTPTAPRIVARGANHQVWHWETYAPGPNGMLETNTHSYTELASGLNYQDANGQWQASRELIESYPGGAIARQGQYQVIFANNLNSYGAIDLQTPDQKRLRSNILGLMYVDTATGDAVMIAKVQDATGQLISANQVLYTNAFAGVKADVRYTYRKGGFEQDVILREQPPTPESYGMNPDTTVLEVVTEFINPPNATVTETGRTAAEQTDEAVDWGATRLGRGKAFDLNRRRADVPPAAVSKQYVEVQGRHFLLERVPFERIQPELSNLPLQSSVDRRLPTMASKKPIYLPTPLARTDKQPMRLATVTPANEGYVLDYVTTSSSLTNYTFQGDSTYYISGIVNLYGTNTIEGGAVLKYATNTSVTLSGSSPVLKCQTRSYCPAIFTAKDDNNYGEAITGSSGNPSGYYANPALTCSGFANGNQIWSNLHILHAKYGIQASSYQLTLYNLQMEHCSSGLSSSYQVLNVKNALFSNVSTNFILNYGSIWVANATVNNSALLSTGSGPPYLTNCILANVTNLGAASGTTSGNFNGFYQCPSPYFGLVRWYSSSNPFQAVGGGSYYLTNGCAFKNVGTTNIDSGLLAQLRQKTTCPPIVYSNITFSVATSLSPQAQRDTDTPDLGYHYDPLDYCFGGVTVNSNLTFTAGTAVGWFQLPGSGGPGYGIRVTNRMTVAFNGTATAPCIFTFHTTAQEGGNGLWTDRGWLGGIASYGSFQPSDPDSLTKIHAQFTKFSHLANDPQHFRDYYTILGVQGMNCEFYGNNGGYDMELAFTNCLFYRAAFGQSTADSQYVWETWREIYRNCTFYGGSIQLNHWESAPYWQVSIEDCSFENTAFPITSTGLSCDYNAYLTNAPQLPITGSHDVVVSGGFNWQSSWLGDFYLPADSPLINAGSTTADQVGLYHFTTQTNQMKETNSIVDIGYHYVAVDANGNPIDTDGDGIPDYLADSNGNGSADSGEINWLWAITTQPASQSAYAGDDVYFSVGVTGAAAPSYQWYFNGVSITGATNASLELDNIQTNNAGNYYVVVSNGAGSLTSQTAALTGGNPIGSYVLLNGSLTNYTFQGDTTYYANSTVQLYGTTVMEGGTVIKYGNHPTSQLVLNGPLACQTSLYRPVLLTSKDDDTIGAGIHASTGSPTNVYQATYLVDAGGQTNAYRGLHIKYAGTGIQGTNEMDVWDCQFVQCGTAVANNAGAGIRLHNVLMTRTTNCVSTAGNVAADFLTADQCQTFCPVTFGGATLTNCLLTAVGNTNGVSGGANNQFLGSAAGVFQTVGDGAYYLAANCPAGIRGAGTTNMDPTVLADIQGKTTYPPLLLTNQTVSVDINLNPQAQRDTDAPDLGYHYDPIDYLVNYFWITNATLTLSNGVCIGVYNDTGFIVGDGSSIVSIGSPLKPNWFVRYSCAQEQPGALVGPYGSGGSPASGMDINPYHTNAANYAQFKFTKFVCPAGGGYHLYHAQNNWTFNNLLVQNCEFWNGVNYFGGYTNSMATLMNNLFWRSPVQAVPINPIARSYLLVTNNLFWKVPSVVFGLRFASAGSTNWCIFNNDFDSCSQVGNVYVSITNGYNAYLNCVGYIYPTNSTDIFATNGLSYQTGSLGDFYQPSDSPLIDKGSTTADQVGLYHFTTQTNQMKETNSIVDIGYHYVAVDLNGNPIDTDGDGVPDYIEDANGNGIHDGGESSGWTDYFNGSLPVLTIVSGDNQSGVTNNFLSLPLTVSLRDTNGIALINAPLTFIVTVGDALISASTNDIPTNSVFLKTGTNGQAAVYAFMPATWQSLNRITATAQSGTNSVQVTFTASALQQLKLWLRADLGVTNTGGAVSAWADQSGNANNATQTATGNQPSYVTNAINGCPVVRFNGTNSQYFNLTNFISVMTTATGAEAIVVLKAVTKQPSQLRGLWHLGNSTASGWDGYPGPDGSLADDFGSSIWHLMGVPAQAVDQFCVYEVASQSNSWAVWLNGISFYQTNGNAFNFSGTPTTLGISHDYYNRSQYNYPFDGDMAEVLVFNRTLTQAERDAVNDYLNLKYGLVSVPAPPTSLVANTMSAGQIGLTWNYGLITSSTTFEIERKVGAGGTYAEVASVRNVLSYLDTNLMAGTSYYYRVKAHNAAGDSGYSNETNATTLASGADVPLSSLVLWLKADSGLVLQSTNNGVRVWYDQSGNHNDGTQGNPSQNPSYVTNAINGYPVVRFNATNSQYFVLPRFMNNLSGAEMIAVVKVAQAVPASWRTLAHFGVHGAAYPYTDGTISDGFASGTLVNIGKPAQPLNQYHLYDGASTNGFRGIWINGLLQYTTTNNAYAPADNYTGQQTYNTALGGDEQYHNYFDGDMAEVLVFGRTLTQAERDAVNDYLNLKYGLVSAPAAPTNLVANPFLQGQVSLIWSFNLPTTSTIFKIERKAGVGGTYAEVAEVRNVLSYVDTNLAANTQYYYRVKAGNAVGDSGYSNETNAMTLATGPNLPAVSSLLLWLKADSSLLLQGATNGVKTWFDQSGNHNDASLVSASQPVWNSGVLNGMPVVRFNATNSQCFNLPSTLLNGITGAEAVVVLKVAEATPETSRALWEMGGSGHAPTYPDTSGNISEDFGSAATHSIGKPIQPLDQYHVYDVAGQANFWAAWINGLSLSYVNNNTFGTYLPWGPPTLGRGPNGSLYFNGDIAEVLVFGRVLTQVERDEVNDYLNLKYGLVNVPAAPTNLVANAVSQSQVSLTWNYHLPTTSIRFEVERKVGVGGTYAEVAEMRDGLSYLDTNLDAGTTYYYRVFASNAAGDSGYSNETNATTLAMGSDLPLADMRLWLKADSGLALQSTNNGVKTWFDQSGNHNDATVASASQPVLTNGVLNGMPVVRFNATNSQYFNLPSTLLNGTTGAEAVVVLKAAVAVPGSANRSLWTMGNFSGHSYYPASNGSITENFASTSDHSYTPFQSLEHYLIYDVAGQTNFWTAWINGQTQQSNTNNTYTTTTYNRIGNATQGSAYFDGDMAEVLVFGRTLTQAERNTVNNYLVAKYQLLPTIVITSPTNNEVMVAPANIVINVDAWDYAGINQVEFFNSSDSLGVVSNAPCSLTWSNVTSGIYALTATATDNNNNKTSTSVSVVVDNRPDVIMTAPDSNLLYAAGSSIKLSAIAWDTDGTVAQVLFVSGTNIIGIATNTPYSCLWSNALAGNYELTAVATDNYGVTAISSVVNISIDSPPSVSITNPANQAVFIADTNINLSADASDSDGQVVKVEFFQGTRSLGFVTNTPYSLAWNNVGAGSYALKAIATDDQGLTVTSSVVNIMVSGIVITNPANNIVLTAPAGVSVGATVMDDAGVDQVQFYDGTNSIGTSASPPYGVTWNGVGSGVYDLWAQSTNQNSLVLTSDIIKMIVDSDPSNTDRDGDGVDDYIEYIEGRNPLIPGADPDDGGLIKLQVYTPLNN